MQLYTYTSEAGNSSDLLFTATQQWSFVARSIVVDPDASELKVNLNATDGSRESTGDVLYAGVVVVQGDFADGDPPTYSSDGHSVQWQGQELDNYVENGNASHQGITLKPFVEDRVATAEVIASQAIAPLLDLGTYEGQGLSVYASYISVLMDSYWAEFGWMNVRLPSSWYVVVKGLTLASLAGALWNLWRLRWRASPSARSTTYIVALSLLVVLTGFAMAFLREVPPLGQSQGRYALPVVVPFAIVLYTSLRSWWPQAASDWLVPVLLLFLAALNTEILIVAVNQ
jgi:hypothetical protein